MAHVVDSVCPDDSEASTEREDRSPDIVQQLKKGIEQLQILRMVVQLQDKKRLSSEACVEGTRSKSSKKEKAASKPESKLIRDVDWVLNSLVSLRDCFVDKGAVALEAILTDIVEEEEKLEKQLCLLNEELQLKRGVLKQEKDELNRLQEDIDTKVEKQKMALAVEQDNLHDAEIRNGIHKLYYERYLEAWFQFHRLKLGNTEEEIKDALDRMDVEKDREARAHAEIEIFLNNEMVALEREIQDRLTKTELHTTMKDQELALLIAKKEEIDHEKVKFQEMLIEREAVLEEDRIEKEELEAQRQLWLRLNHASVMIQAWWKGCMVRKNLGPYRRVAKFKKSAGDGKGASKKSKKKHSISPKRTDTTKKGGPSSKMEKQIAEKLTAKRETNEKDRKIVLTERAKEKAGNDKLKEKLVSKEGPKAKSEGGPKAKAEEGPKAKAGGPKAKAEGGPKAKAEGGPKAKPEEGPKAKAGGHKAKAEEGAKAKAGGPKAKPEGGPKARPGPKAKTEAEPKDQAESGLKDKSESGLKDKGRAGGSKESGTRVKESSGKTSFREKPGDETGKITSSTAVGSEVEGIRVNEVVGAPVKRKGSSVKSNAETVSGDRRKGSVTFKVDQEQKEANEQEET